MRRLTTILTTLFFIATTGSFAQPLFTSADMPNVGDHDTLMILQYHAITNNLDSETGNGYTWDFTSLPFHVQNFRDVDSFRVKQHFASNPFPSATIEEFKNGITGQTVNLYSYRNDTLIIHRQGGPETSWALGPMASMAFPISFGSAKVIKAKVYTGTGFGILVGERTTTSIYDGFGTLKMPDNKSHDNVFRVKLIERDTSYVTGTVNSATSYLWYKQGGQVPLLRLVYTGALNLYFVFGSKAFGTTTAITNIHEQARTKIFPNPSNGRFRIQFDDPADFQRAFVQVYNSCGKEIQHTRIVRNVQELQLNQFSAGFYLLKIFDGSSLYTQMLQFE